MIHTACEQYNFQWSPEELAKFRALWKNGNDIADIALKLKRKPAEIAFIIIDQADRNKIRQRPGGAFGEPKKFTPEVREMLVANRF